MHNFTVISNPATLPASAHRAAAAPLFRTQPVTLVSLLRIFFKAGHPALAPDAKPDSMEWEVLGYLHKLPAKVRREVLELPVPLLFKDEVDRRSGYSILLAARTLRGDLAGRFLEDTTRVLMAQLVEFRLHWDRDQFSVFPVVWANFPPRFVISPTLKQRLTNADIYWQRESVKPV